MAFETLFLDGTFSGTGWTGNGTDIDEGISAADGNEISSDSDGEGDLVTLDFSDSALSDSDTIIGVDITIRCRVSSATGNDSMDIELLIGGVGQGIADTGIITASHANYTVNNVAWDADWTAAQLNGMQMSAVGRQIGMPVNTVWHIDSAEAVIEYTPGSSGGWLSRNYWWDNL